MRKMISIGVVFLPITAALAQSAARPAAIRPAPAAGVSGFGFRGNAGANFGRRAAAFAYPLNFGDYDSGFTGYMAAPNVVVQQPPAFVMLPEQPVESTRPEIHEYPAASVASPASSEESPTFSLVLKDGTVRSAVAVTVQNNTVHFVDPDGGHNRLPLEAIDRTATRQRNREHQLDLQLPPSSR